MAITAKLQFGNNVSKHYAKTYLVVDWRTHFLTRYNNIRPEGSPRCECLEITLIAPDKSDLSIYEWFIDGSAMSGRLLLDYSATIHSDSVSSQEVAFEEAQCFGISEHYNIDDHSRRLLSLKIAPSSITISDICIDMLQ